MQFMKKINEKRSESSHPLLNDGWGQRTGEGQAWAAWQWVREVAWEGAGSPLIYNVMQTDPPKKTGKQNPTRDINARTGLDVFLLKLLNPRPFSLSESPFSPAHARILHSPQESHAPSATLTMRGFSGYRDGEYLIDPPPVWGEAHSLCGINSPRCTRISTQWIDVRSVRFGGWHSMHAKRRRDAVHAVGKGKTSAVSVHNECDAPHAWGGGGGGQLNIRHHCC